MYEDEYRILPIFEKHGIDNDNLKKEIIEHLDKTLSIHLEGVDKQRKGIHSEYKCYLLMALNSTRNGSKKELVDRIKKIIGD